VAPGGPEGRDELLAEINVTPFVDVMLVLLIIFMVVAPLMTVGVPVDLPRAPAAPAAEAREPLVVSLDAEGRVFLDCDPVPEGALAALLRPLAAAAPDRPVFVRGDRAQPYGAVMRLLAELASAGFARAALIGEGGP